MIPFPSTLNIHSITAITKSMQEHNLLLQTN